MSNKSKIIIGIIVFLGINIVTAHGQEVLENLEIDLKPLPILPGVTDPELLSLVNQSESEPKLLSIVPDNRTQKFESVFDKSIIEEYWFFITLVVFALFMLAIFFLKKTKR